MDSVRHLSRRTKLENLERLMLSVQREVNSVLGILRSNTYMRERFYLGRKIQRNIITKYVVEGYQARSDVVWILVPKLRETMISLFPECLESNGT